MRLSAQEKILLKREIVDCLCTEKEVQKIVVFGSFLVSDNPHDIDVAVFQNSTKHYLQLALKYRQKTRSIARRIPLDIVPLKSWTSDDPFLAEVDKGEVVYERCNKQLAPPSFSHTSRPETLAPGDRCDVSLAQSEPPGQTALCRALPRGARPR